MICSFFPADIMEENSMGLFSSDADLEPLPFYEKPTESVYHDDHIVYPPSANSFVVPVMNKSIEMPSSSLFDSMYGSLTRTLSFQSFDPRMVSAEDIPGPSNFDVVCSRGRRFAELPGCIRFRSIVDCFVPPYIMALTRGDKSSVIAMVVEQVLRHEEGDVRFLKYNSKKTSWSIMGRDQIRDKVGHAIRERIQEMYRAERLASRQRQKRSM